MSRGLKERAVALGAERGLIGILVEPLARSRTALVLLNAGAVPRFGPNRRYVIIARAAAAQGLAVCRFDFSGIGDSAHAAVGKDPHANVFHERACGEVGQVVSDLQQRFGFERFIIGGMCSGADVALQFGVIDSRVAGLILINGLLTSDGSGADLAGAAGSAMRLRGYRSKLFRYQSWWRVLTGRSGLWQNLAKAPRTLPFIAPPKSDVDDAMTQDARVMPDPRWESLANRAVDVALLYSEWSTTLDHFRVHVEPNARHWLQGDALSLSILPDCDHVFTRRADQAHLLRHVLRCCDRMRVGDAAPLPTRSAPYAALESR